MSYATLGALLRDLRGAAGLTQGALAERAGIARQTYIDFEADHRIPKRSTLSSILRALDADDAAWLSGAHFVGAALLSLRHQDAPDEDGEPDSGVPA